MGIPNSQLETWSHQGAIAGSSDTYQAIKATLEAKGTPYASKTFKVFLQGSYGNDTNIYAESDVDVVIQLNDCFQSDRDRLSSDQAAKWAEAHNDATYTHVEFKRDVLQVLTDAYGADVVPGDKAIAIAARGKRRKVDVVVAIQYRRYIKFLSLTDQEFIEGMCFYNGSNQIIANYPRHHSANLTKRHQDSGEWLKPMIRVFKNARSKLVDRGIIEAKQAPSYFVEGLLYNVPSDKFGTSYEDSFVNAYNWLQTDSLRDKLVTANEQYYLIRDGFHYSWPKANVQAYLDGLSRLWNEWE